MTDLTLMLCGLLSCITWTTLYPTADACEAAKHIPHRPSVVVARRCDPHHAKSEHFIAATVSVWLHHLETAQ